MEQLGRKTTSFQQEEVWKGRVYTRSHRSRPERETARDRGTASPRTALQPPRPAVPGPFRLHRSRLSRSGESGFVSLTTESAQGNVPSPPAVRTVDARRGIRTWLPNTVPRTRRTLRSRPRERLGRRPAPLTGFSSPGRLARCPPRTLSSSSSTGEPTSLQEAEPCPLVPASCIIPWP